MDSIRVHVPSGNHVVILKERNAERYVPIWIGPSEANAIALKITGVAPERPITHDLMVNAFSTMGVAVRRVVVTSLDDTVFFARLHLRHGSLDADVDARPSDAIAIAVRVECPIYVSGEVMERAGVTPAADEDAESEADEPDESRLAVFRDLVNSLDLPDLPDEPGGRTSSS